MTGGIRGDDGPGGLPPSKTGVNWPDAVFDCPAINVIALHGYYTHNGADLSNKHWVCRSSDMNDSANPP